MSDHPPALKHLSMEAVPRAIEKADRYRLLNEPLQAQSICLDILRTDPENQRALIILLLALTDQFGGGFHMSATEPQDVLARLKSPYDKQYYAGIVAERRGTALLDENAPATGFLAYELLTKAMKYYEAAAALQPPGNDDALLRWNTCARLLNTPHVRPRPEDTSDWLLE